MNEVPVETGRGPMDRRAAEATRPVPDRIHISDALVHDILLHHRSFEWTAQGFGFVRLKLGGVGRIHVWDHRFRVPGVSDIHAHPWDLRSRIVSGELINHRFAVAPDTDDRDEDEDEPGRGRLNYVMSRIATGEGGHLIGEPRDVALIPRDPEAYYAGDIYSQSRHELHRTLFEDGTVTLVERLQGGPLEETTVYWPRGTVWVSAEPRPTGDLELSQAIDLALRRWQPRVLKTAVEVVPR